MVNHAPHRRSDDFHAHVCLQLHRGVVFRWTFLHVLQASYQLPHFCRSHGEK
ncbi:hypothetical protein JOB18_011347 [Solea senegalensis]|uniref:Uncharacterized protein n=1 Tax=Solea senegalensis TaxID=28829 RepID=A0AAV6QVB0_SOLSE|nr:hypothetical protein JOB18_011347 [Solea senegalensis]